MYTIDKFIEDTLFLTNSLVIKISDIATVINKGVYLTTGEVIPDDPRLWKYYLNLSGQKHITNNDVTVYIIETDTVEYLSKELLEQYPYTKKELQKHGDAYKELIANFPSDIDFIKGCLYPVDIEYAISAGDGTILNYNKNMVETQELSLIRELEIEIYSFLARWHVRNYVITDELYLSSLVGVLYSTIPSSIINLRSNKIYTAEAHSFHLEHFFRSRLDLWDQVQVLTNETKYWLYQNLNYLMVNTSKNTTLDTILTKIFEANDIGVGTFTLEVGQPIHNGSASYDESAVTNTPSRFIAEQLNNKYEIGQDKYMDTESIINMELFNNPDLDTTIPEEALNTFVDETTLLINKTSSVSQKTKILDIDSIKLFKIYGNDPYMAIMDHWLYLSTNKQFVNKIMFTDPNTKQSYPLTPLEGLYFLYYMLAELVGKEDLAVSSIKYGYVVNNDITIDELTENMYNIGPARDIATMIKADMPDSIGVINSAEEFGNYLSELKNFYMKVWVYDSNINNGSISANIKHMVTRMYKYGEYKLTDDETPISFKQLLLDIGIELNINTEYDKMETINSLFSTFTGIDVSESLQIDERLELFTELLLKLTSYTTQVIKSIDDNNSIYIPYSTLEQFYSDEGLINVTSAEVISPYETNYSRISCGGNDFRELLIGGAISTSPTISNCDTRKGILFIPKTPIEELDVEVTQPDLYVEIMDPCYDEFSPYLTVEGNDFGDVMNSKDVYTQSRLENVKNIENNNLVTYTDELDKNILVGITTTPNLIVEIEDTID